MDRLVLNFESNLIAHNLLSNSTLQALSSYFSKWLTSWFISPSKYFWTKLYNQFGSRTQVNPDLKCYWKNTDTALSLWSSLHLSCSLQVPKPRCNTPFRLFVYPRMSTRYDLAQYKKFYVIICINCWPVIWENLRTGPNIVEKWKPHISQ